MKIAAISDLHGYLPEIEECDVLCICGDITPLEIQRNYLRSEKWFTEIFLTWTKNLPCEKVFLVGGNHDFWLSSESESNIYKIIFSQEIYNLEYLYNNKYSYNGITFYGCPNVENLSGWAFYTANPSRVFNVIPDCDVLLTHAAPSLFLFGIDHNNNDYGSSILTDVVASKNIKYHIFGHIHEGSHIWREYEGTNFCNVSIKDDNYEVKYPVTYFEI